MDTITLDVLNQFDFYSAIPLEGSASYTEIAVATKLPEPVVRRILNWTMIQHVFAETADGRVVHTAITAAVVHSPNRRGWFSHMFEEMAKGAVHQSEALRRFSSGRDDLSEEVLETAFAIADTGNVGKPTSFWDYLNGVVEGKPRDFRSRRFTEAMQVVAMSLPGNVAGLLTMCYAWEALGEGTVVDVRYTDNFSEDTLTKLKVLIISLGWRLVRTRCNHSGKAVPKTQVHCTRLDRSRGNLCQQHPDRCSSTYYVSSARLFRHTN